MGFSLRTVELPSDHLFHPVLGLNTTDVIRKSILRVEAFLIERKRMSASKENLNPVPDRVVEGELDQELLVPSCGGFRRSYGNLRSLFTAS